MCAVSELFDRIVDKNLLVRRMYAVSYTHLPRTRDAYKKIADFFGVDVNYLLTEDEDFVVQASEKYGCLLYTSRCV